MNTRKDEVEFLRNDLEVLLDCKNLEEIETRDPEFKFWKSYALCNWVNDRITSGNMSFSLAKFKVAKELEKQIEQSQERYDQFVKAVNSSKAIVDDLVKYIQDKFEFVAFEDYVIYFNAPRYKYINEVVIDIADKFDLHCGMFSFDSSFTTHDAYTKDQGELKIGITRKSTNPPSDLFVDFYTLRDDANIKTPKYTF